MVKGKDKDAILPQELIYLSEITESVDGYTLDFVMQGQDDTRPAVAFAAT